MTAEQSVLFWLERADFTGTGCRHSQETIAMALGYNRRTIIRATQALAADGHITISKERRPGSKWLCNVYHVKHWNPHKRCGVLDVLARIREVRRTQCHTEENGRTGEGSYAGDTSPSVPSYAVPQRFRRTESKIGASRCRLGASAAKETGRDGSYGLGEGVGSRFGTDPGARSRDGGVVVDAGQGGRVVSGMPRPSGEGRHRRLQPLSANFDVRGLRGFGGLVAAAIEGVPARAGQEQAAPQALIYGEGMGEMQRAPVDLMGRQQPSRFGGASVWFQAVPGLAGQFGKRVPKSHIRRPHTDPAVACPCGAETSIQGRQGRIVECAGGDPCGRYFLPAGDEVFVAGPYQPDAVA
jgi:hypothetical protein